jgi:hypothetical protein
MDYPGKVITKNQVTPTQISATGVWTLDDAAAATRNNNWPVAGVPNPISKSLRFNSADSAYLNRTAGTPTDAKKFTLSLWVKRSTLQPSGNVGILNGASNDTINFSNDNIEIRQLSGGGGRKITTAVFRDVSAWMHVVISSDTTDATASNRIKIWTNNTQQTAFSTNTDPSLNSTWGFNTSSASLTLGLSGGYFGGYMTEVNFIDGQALTPSSFGMTDPVTGVWEPLKYSGTYGTNGFYLNFKDATSTTTLGLDYSGNANNWTTNNFSVTAGAGNDSLTDVPTPWIPYNTTGDVGGVVRGNYCTWNGALPAAIAGPSIATISNGNLDVALLSNVIGDLFLYSTTLLSSGKWYYEFTISATTNNGHGIGASGASFSQLAGSSYAIYRWQSGVVFVNGSNVTTGLATCTTNDVIGVAIDAGAGTIQWFKNNTSLYTATGLTYSNYIPLIYGDAGTGRTFSGSTNFGQRPFAYTPPSGFLSLCTTNLPASTVLKGSEYMNAVLYTGTGSSLGVTGVGFQPDWVWIKGRSGATDHGLYDVLRGVQNQLESNSSGAETVEATGLTAFGSDGFTVGALAQLNTSSATYVAWNWRANGAGVSNTAGTITATVSANTTAGFSIVTYTGTGVNATVGHGLGVAPSMIIIKNRTAPSGFNWNVYHASIGNTQRLFLDSTSDQASGVWNNTSPTSTVFTIAGSAVYNNGDPYVAYCFAPISGFSAFGSYTGNGSADGPFVYLGFRPRYILIKRTDVADAWAIKDTARDPYNVDDSVLKAETSDAESTSTFWHIDELSNGFKLRNLGSTFNNSGGNYIYAAFAENPFKNALAR